MLSGSGDRDRRRDGDSQGYAELKAEYFTPAPADMLNDLFLGFSVVALGLIIWLVRLLMTDPRGVVKGTLFQRKA